MVSGNALKTNGKGRAALLFSVLAVACVVATAFIVVDSDGSDAETVTIYKNDTQIDGSSVYWRIELVQGGDCSSRLVIHGSGTVSIGSWSWDYTSVEKIVVEDGVNLSSDRWFEGWKSSSVSLGNSITSIPESAFENCNNLKTVTMSSNVTSIGKSAFSECTALKTIDLTGVTSIGENAFRGCMVLDTALPASLESIGSYAFYGCKALSNLAMPENVTEIHSNTFYACTGLVSVDLGNVTSIGDFAFSECTGLRDVTMSKVKTIADNSFHGCTSLETVAFGPDLRSIGTNAFAKCTGMKSYSVATGENSDFYTVDGVLFERNVSNRVSIDGEIYDRTETSLVFYPVAKTETSYVIPSEVTYIGASAFYGSENLTSVTLPDNLFCIDIQAFGYCTALESISIPANVKMIGSTTLNTAFVGCTALGEITVDPSNTRYSSLDGVLFDKAQKTIFLYPAGKAGTSYVLPSTVEKIPQFVFDTCANLVSVTLGDNVKAIDGMAFNDCSALTSMTFGSGMSDVSINETAFRLHTPAETYLVFYGEDGAIITYGDGLAGKTFVGNGNNDGVMREYVGPTYTITWKDADDNVIGSTVVKEGDTPVHSDLEKESTAEHDYTFAGWSPALKPATKDATYTAIFTESVRKYTVTFELPNGGSTISVTRYKEYGATLYPGDIPSVPEYNGTDGKPYVFAKWVYKCDGSKVFDTSAPITEDVTVIPVFEVKKFTVRWIVEGEVVKTELLEYGTIPAWDGSEYGKPDDVQYTYQKNGWEGLTGVKITKDTDFTAKFTPVLKYYDIAFMNGEVEFQKNSIGYGEGISAPKENPVKDADDQYTYKFIGWNGFRDGMTVTGTATFEAMFKAILKDLPAVNSEGNTEFDIDGTSVSISDTMLDNLKTQTTGSAMFDFQENGIDLDKATLDALSGDVELSITEATELPQDVKAAVGDRPVYSISLKANDVSVHNLGGKASVTLHYELKDGEMGENLVIWYVNDDGEYTRMPCTYSEAGFVVFETTHFSYYAVMYESPSGNPDDGGNNMVIIAAVAVIALIAVLGLFLFMRSRKAGSA